MMSFFYVTTRTVKESFMKVFYKYYAGNFPLPLIIGNDFRRLFWDQ